MTVWLIDIMRLIYSILITAISEISVIAMPGDTSRLNLIFAGDLMGHDEQISSAWNEVSQTYNYDTCFSVIRDYISSADIAFLNLEVTLAGPPFKGYPQFSSPDELAVAAKNAGFDVFITSNNHAIDRGKNGLERTIMVLDSIGIIHTGTFMNKYQRDAKYPLILEKNNIRLAILNYTYATNGLKVTEPNIVNYIDTLIISNDLEKARSANPDFIIVTIHWGIEYQRNENSEQAGLADFIFKHGADMIIGSHPHVIQPIKKYYPEKYDSSQNKIVVFSLGNFISNQRERYRNGGLIFNFSLEKTDITRVSQSSVYPVYVHKPYSGKWAKYFVLIPVNDFDKMVEKFSMSPEVKESYKTFKEDSETLLKESKW